MNHSRRDLLKMGVGAIAASLLPIPVLAASLNKMTLQRRISLYNTHTCETVDVCFYDNGAYRPDALKQIDHILRDHRTDEVQPIDLSLVETLYAIKSKVRSKAPFYVISGYRSPTTNAMLRQKSNGVAQTSYHTIGKAIDIRLPGYGTRRLRNVSISLRNGGVGYYGRSNFVHLDTGPIRAW